MTLAKFIATSGIALAATCGIASAQTLPEGRLYAFHSGPQHSCPGLDWHIVADGNNLSGMIAWNNMQSIAHVAGTLNPTAHTFQMTVQEQGGQGRTATITGSVEASGYLVADISGPNVKCTGVRVQWFPVGATGGGRG
jgi:hypothetical protein